MKRQNIQNIKEYLRGDGVDGVEVEVVTLE